MRPQVRVTWLIRPIKAAQAFRFVPRAAVEMTRLFSKTNSRREATSEIVYPPTQPPSAKRTDRRPPQLIRLYTSLLRSSPVILLFHYNNLTTHEWTAVRREFKVALAKVPLPEGYPANFAEHVKIKVVNTGVLALAFKIIEFFIPGDPRLSVEQEFQHDLSDAAHKAVKKAVESGVTDDLKTTFAQLKPLLFGPLALVSFPAISPAHLAAMLSVLAPILGKFDPPLRKDNPNYFERNCQQGLSKLMLIGGRIEGRVMGTDAIQQVGGMTGGIGGMRSQMISMLHSAGLSITHTIDGARSGLWLMLEGRKTMLEDAESNKPKGANGGTLAESAESTKSTP